MALAASTTTASLSDNIFWWSEPHGKIDYGIKNTSLEVFGRETEKEKKSIALAIIANTTTDVLQHIQ